MKNLPLKIEQKVFRQVTPDYLKKLYKSTLRQMEAVIQAHGGYTKYLFAKNDLSCTVMTI